MAETANAPANNTAKPHKKIIALKVVKCNHEGKEGTIIKLIHVNAKLPNGLTLREARKAAEQTKIDYEKVNAYKLTRWRETVEIVNIY